MCLSKRTLLFSFFAALCALFVNSRIYSQASVKYNFWSDVPDEELASYIVNNMTDDELFAQILMFGWAGNEPSVQLMQWIDQRNLGSAKVYGWGTDNTTNVAKSVKLVQEHSQQCRFQIPMYIATDQEGGIIRHIKGDTSDTPGNLAIGAGGYAYDAFYTGYYIALELRYLGVNMNFAPTVDIYTNLKSTVIGPRSFGSDPKVVGAMGSAFCAGSIKAGVIPTAKHFPGHGDTDADSHGSLPKINIDIDTLFDRELIPFKYLIEQNVPAIMSGHLSFPKILKNGEPASLSKYFLTDILRDTLGYKGLIITDDMMMNGATIYAGSLSRAVRLAIEAGNDIVISSTTAQLQEPLWTNNLELMKTNPQFHATVKKAAEHVILSKLKYFKSESSVPVFPDIENLHKNIPNKEAEKYFIAQACRSITFERALNTPLDKNSPVLIASQFLSFIREGKNKFTSVSEHHFNYKMGPNETQWNADQIEKKIPKTVPVIITIMNDDSVNLANLLCGKGYKVYIVSITSPLVIKNDLSSLKNAQAIIYAYSSSRFSAIASFAVLTGDFIPQGKLPL
jgi:beta-N-acetylhexosaminidase